MKKSKITLVIKQRIRNEIGMPDEKIEYRCLMNGEIVKRTYLSNNEKKAFKLNKTDKVEMDNIAVERLIADTMEIIRNAVEEVEEIPHTEANVVLEMPGIKMTADFGVNDGIRTIAYVLKDIIDIFK